MSTIKLWLENSRDWLDGYGKSAWIAAMVLGFIFLWPVGLALLFYMIGTKRMGKYNFSSKNGRYNFTIRAGSSGNTAFDSYREETLKRLEEEQAEFQSFMAKLREAKDKAEFDQFMDNREARGVDAPNTPPAPKPGFDATPSPA
ncbi:MAG: DUF2852 domain-containing protein [Rhodobacteraceae bacterium]|nr:DUF2852 domain-containing protein [Paracoccaceae bacterium]